MMIKTIVDIVVMLYTVFHCYDFLIRVQSNRSNGKRQPNGDIITVWFDSIPIRYVRLHYTRWRQMSILIWIQSLMFRTFHRLWRSNGQMVPVFVRKNSINNNRIAPTAMPLLLGTSVNWHHCQSRTITRPKVNDFQYQLIFSVKPIWFSFVWIIFFPRRWIRPIASSVYGQTFRRKSIHSKPWTLMSRLTINNK